MELTNELYYRPDTFYASTLIDTRRDEDRADAAYVIRSRLDVSAWTQNWGYAPQMGGLYENELTLELDITGEYVDENIPDQIRRGIDERGCSTWAGYRLTHRVFGPPVYRESSQSEDESDLTGNR